MKSLLSFLPFNTSAVVAIALIALSGCSVDYGPNSGARSFFFDTGHSETQLAPNVWRVSYSDDEYGANGSTQDQISDLALLRAAWLCQQNGYPWFRVAAQRDMASPFECDPNLYYMKSSILVTGLNSQVPGALNAQFILTSLSSKYRISPRDLER